VGFPWTNCYQAPTMGTNLRLDRTEPWVAPIDHSQAEVKQDARHDIPKTKQRMNMWVVMAHHNQPRTCILHEVVHLCTQYKAPHGPVGIYDTSSHSPDELVTTKQLTHCTLPATCEHASMTHFRTTSWLRAGSARDQSNAPAHAHEAHPCK